MKKSFFLSCVIASAILFAGCSNAAPIEEALTIEEALRASEEFTNRSIGSCLPSRANPQASTTSSITEDDKWEGYFQYSNGTGLWCVPSYKYGVKAGDSLIVNGEDLGTLQNLEYKKDEKGNYRSAKFVYKNQTYYVFDKSDFVKNANYNVIGTAVDDKSIIIDQSVSYNSPDFSNFRFWFWDRDLADDLYRVGDLGYAYTVRNLEMPDGSYATVTVAGYNYYNYGFRVWIKETASPVEKKLYPNDTPYSFTSKYTPKTMPTVASGEDFIYEIKNETGGVLKVRNYIRDYNVYDFENGIAAYYGSDFFEIPNGQTQQFKYKLSTLKGYLPFATNKAGIGCRFQLEGNNNTPSGWENNFNVAGRKHTVIVTKDGNYMNGENQWSDL